MKDGKKAKCDNFEPLTLLFIITISYHGCITKR